MKACSICGKEFKTDVNRHMKTHSEPDVRCPWKGCTYKGHQKGNMKSHYMRRHAKDRKHKCKITIVDQYDNSTECEAPFINPCELKVHQNTVHVIRPTNLHSTMGTGESSATTLDDGAPLPDNAPTPEDGMAETPIQFVFDKRCALHEYMEGKGKRSSEEHESPRPRKRARKPNSKGKLPLPRYLHPSGHAQSDHVA